MPKERLDISGFSTGVHLSATDERTPVDAITGNSLDWEHTDQNHLRPVRRPLALGGSAETGGLWRFLKRFFLENVPMLLGYTPTGTNPGFHVMTDTPTGDTVKTYVANSNKDVDPDKMTAQVSNSAIHIGVGKNVDNPPLWIGKHIHNQFGIPPSGNYEIDLAECHPAQVDTGVFDNAYKAVFIETTQCFMAIDFEGNRISKFNSSGAFVEAKVFFENSFTAITDMGSSRVGLYCHARKSIFVLNADDFSIFTIITLANFSYPQGRFVTDMAYSDGHIFMIVTDPDSGIIAGEDKKNWLYTIEYWQNPNIVIQPDNISFSIPVIEPDTQIATSDIQTKSGLCLHPYILGGITNTAVAGTTQVLPTYDEWDIMVSPISLVKDLNGGVFVMAVPVTDATWRYNTPTGQYSIPGGTHRFGFVVNSNEGYAGVCVALLVNHDQSHKDQGFIKNSHIRVLDSDIHQYTAVNWGSYSPLILSPWGRPQSNPYSSLRDDFSQLHVYAWREAQGIETVGRTVGVRFTNDILPTGNVVPWQADIYYRYFEGNLHYRILHVGVNAFLFSPPSSSLIATYTLTAVGNEWSGSGQAYSIKRLNLARRSGGFVDDTAYNRLFYAVSLVYDEISESPLSGREAVTVSRNDAVDLEININTNISRRVSHLNVYRAFGRDNNVQISPMRLVESIPLFNEVPKPEIPPDSGTFYHRVIYTDIKSDALLGPAFESSAGLPETLKNTLPHYGLSAMMDNTMYIADCWHPDIPDASLFLFRSNRFAVDTFNWPEHNVRLPSRPIAMEEFGGRLFVFDEADCHVVDPSGMYVERTFVGVGAAGRNAICRTPEGIFVAGRYHAYVFTGSGREIISTPIESDTANIYGYNDIADAQRVLVRYSEERREVYFVFGMTNSLVLCYDLRRGIWRIERLSGRNIQCLTDNHYGHLLAGIGTELQRLNKGTQVQGARLRMRELNFGQLNSQKWIYGLKIQSTQAVTAYINEETTIANPEVNGQYYWYPLTANRKYRTLRPGIAAPTADTVIKGLSVIFRRKQIHGGQDA